MTYKSRLGGATLAGEDNFINEILSKTFKETKGLSPKTEREKLIEKLKSSIVLQGQENEEPACVLRIRNFSNGKIYIQPFLTLGNFSVYTGKQKSKKTFFTTACIAAISSNSDVEKKLVGDVQGNRANCMYFDTEQAKYDSAKIIKRACDLGAKISNINVFSLRAFSPEERVKMIEVAIEEYSKTTSYMVIDGIADLITNINDIDQASFISTKLLKWTAKYDIHITVIIHQNKDNNWATGHLGSTLIKKAECVVSLTEDSEDKSISNVKCDNSRSKPFNEFKIRIDNNGKLNIDGMKNIASKYPEIRTIN